MPDPLSNDGATNPRYLLNESGAPFEDLAEVGPQLAELDTDRRIEYRNANAARIATADAGRLLIVAGPGSGKSFLFLQRIRHWLPLDEHTIYVSTFVRKLVIDLRTDLEQLEEADRERVTVSTLHTLARSLLERSHGTLALPMRPHIRIIDDFWAQIVWQDVQLFHTDSIPFGSYPFWVFEDQLQNDMYSDEPDWVALGATYRELCQFYNSVGFALLINFSREAVEESPSLVEDEFWIIDEYQDFNTAEDRFVQTVTRDALGILKAGDDEQALYQELKGATPDIIVRYYGDEMYAKAMLPFCSRCDYYICLAASAFITSHRDDGAIEKGVLPLRVEPASTKVQLVAAAAPSSAVAFVRGFLADRAEEYATYLEERAKGLDADPFLLILAESSERPSAARHGR